MFATLKGGGEDLVGEGGAAHHLHDDLDARVGDDLKGIAAELVPRHDGIAGLVDVADGDAVNVDGCAEAPFDGLSVVVEELQDARAHDAAADEANADPSWGAAVGLSALCLFTHWLASTRHVTDGFATSPQLRTCGAWVTFWSTTSCDASPHRK